MKRISLVLAACALSAACSPQQAEEPAAAPPEAAAMPDTHGKMGGMAAASPGDSVATQGYKSSMNTMMEEMPAFTGDADVDFMKQMRGHHVAAVSMARVELAQGKDAQARARCRRRLAPRGETGCWAQRPRRRVGGQVMLGVFGLGPPVPAATAVQEPLNAVAPAPRPRRRKRQTSADQIDFGF